MKRLLPYFLLLIPYFLFLSSCKKDSFITSPNAIVITSTDSVKFDTVFTSVGSVTQSFKIFNLNDQKLLLSKVKLMGGNASSFRININGSPVSELDNIEVDANDSIYVFVTVNINPTNANLSFIVSDSILINFNGNSDYVQLQAYGQNAHFLNNQVLTGSTSWADTLPYVILGSLRVDTTASLTIPAGCRVYMHANAPILVDGTLIVTGTTTDSVLFTGDRLDAAYSDLPGSWPGIYFRGTSNNDVLTHAVLQNADQAIVADSPSINANPKLILHRCIINNASTSGIFSDNSSIDADNSLVMNCANNIQLTDGGTYHFVNCTVAGYGNVLLSHQNPVLQATNYSLTTNSTNGLDAVFQNCIFWGDDGNVSDEVFVGKQGSTAFTVLLDHSLYKGTINTATTDTTAVIVNRDPMFNLVDNTDLLYDLRTTNTLAPGLGKGSATPSFNQDLNDSSRTNAGLTDIGCYEKQ
jgi:hypothetical protein